MNDYRRRWFRRLAIAAFLLPAVLVVAEAQPAVAPLDPFMLELDSAVADYQATIDFSKPIDPARPLAPASSAPKPPYTLDNLLALAAVGNFGLKAKAAEEDAARSEFNSARARRLPTLKSSVNGTYIANPGERIVVPGFFIGLPEDVVLSSGRNSLYDFKLTGDLPLYSWGKIRLGIDLARTGLGVAAVQRQKAEHELAVRIRASWDSLAYIGRARQVLDLQARVGARLVELSEKSLAAGFLTRADLAGARIRLKEIDMAKTRLDERRDKLLSALASMAGLPRLSLGQLRMAVPRAGAPRWTEDALWPVAKDGNYDLALSSALLDSRQGLKRLAEKKALGLPDIGLHVELSYGGSRFPLLERDWREDDDYQLTISLGAEGNLLGDAVKISELARARAELAQAEAQNADAERSIQDYVHETYLGIELARARLEYAALKQEGWAADLAQMRATIQAGAGSESEYLGLMIEALGGLAEAYGTLAEYRSSLLSLEAVAGSKAVP